MPIFIIKKQLAQRLPTTTASAVLYKVPDANTTTFIRTIVVCNVTAGAATYSLYVNQNGSVAADQFALVRSLSVAANATDQRNYADGLGIILNGANASVIVSSSIGSALTFTLYGEEVVQT